MVRVNCFSDNINDFDAFIVLSTKCISLFDKSLVHLFFRPSESRLVGWY